MNRKAIFFTYLITGVIIFISSVSFYPVVITGLISITSSFLITLLYPARLESRLIFTLLYLILGFIAELLSFYSISVLHPAHSRSILFESETRLLILLVSTFFMLFFILVIKWIKRERDYKINQAYYLIMVVIILISLLILNTIFSGSKKNLFFVFSIIGILCINFLVIFLFDKMNEKFKLEEENYHLQKQMEYQDNSFEKTAHSFENIKRIIHDTNKQLVYIRACIQDNQFQEAVQHIEQTLNHIHASYESVATGNLAIDALVSNALNIAYDNNISVKSDIRVAASAINIDRFDLCVVFGNLLDNAIEAASLVNESEDKFIHLQIFTDRFSLFIHIVNARRESGIHVGRTLKKNPEFHGIGLTNVQRVAEKYGGHLRTEARTTEYETTVFLPFPKNL